MDDENCYTEDLDCYLKAMLAIVVWREARGEGIEGMRAVAHVIRNRVLAWRQDWDQVIAGRNQFSSMSVSGDSQLMVWPDDDDPLFRQVWARCCAVYEGKNEDPTRGAVYYANLDTMTSSWFKENIVNKPSVHPMTVKIGRHAFFK